MKEVNFTLEAFPENPMASSIHYMFPEDLKAGFNKPLEVIHDENHEDSSNTIFNDNYGVTNMSNMFDDCFVTESAEDISMEVQDAPEEEIDVNVGMNPVDIAKAEPENVTIAAEAGEFYIDASDLELCADLNEASIIDTLVAVAEANRSEDCDINVNNTTVLLDESTIQYQRIFEKAGIVCNIKGFKSLNEEGEIDMNVQEGPDGDINAKMDEKASDPVDDAKRCAGNIVIGCKDGKCYIDAKDLEKYADANEQHPADSVKDIVEANLEYGMNNDNVVVAVTEGSSIDLIRALIESEIPVEGFINESDIEEEDEEE